MSTACTIVARNYLALARVLARTFVQHHPGSQFHVLLLDDVDHTVEAAGEPFEVVRPSDVMGHETFAQMAVMYDVLELSTAVKPWLLRHLLDRGADAVTYLDPDIMVFSRFAELEELGAQHPVVLTPHNTDPLPRDGRTPDEEFILKAGVYNLGFITVARGANAFLDWWAERLRTDCIVAPARQRFVDQRWVDMAVGYFPHVQLRHPGYNVAYWNLGARHLTHEEGEIRVNGEPLRFFHFSGFDPEMPERLSKHEGARPRYDIGDDQLLGELWGTYRDQLLAAGHAATSATGYAYANLPDGTPLTAATRRAYRQAVIEHLERGGPAPPDALEAPGEFAAWLERSAPPPGVGWRYVDRWSPLFPEELEHVLMAISRRPRARRATGALATWLWRRRSGIAVGDDGGGGS